MHLWKDYLKKIWKAPVLAAAMLLMTALVFYLYGVSPEPVLYSAILCLLAGLGAGAVGFSRYKKQRQDLEFVKESPEVNLGSLPTPQDKNEELYKEILRSLNEERMKAEDSRKAFYTELTDYYTMWVHQIKNPITAARLLLQEDGERRQDVLGELFKIEEYVEMVLGYLRTEDMASDLKFELCSLDSIIREQIHKFARIFIGKKIALEYEGTEKKVLTDSKWLGFVIGQVLSNGLKYTKTGQISIYMSQSRPHTLVIEDTGIGILAEDLPRVFEKGFTGCNGRGEERSTGIGLYLCGKIMKRLGHDISLDSVPGKGTKVFLALGRKNLDMY